MKKIASILLAVLVAFSMFSFAVSAASVNFTVTADKTTVKAGDKVNVKISIPENAGLATLQVVIKYDKEAFKVTNAKAGGLYGFEEVNPKTGFYASAASTAPTKGGVLYTVELEALKATDSKISLVVNEATDNDFNEVKVSFNEVSIKGYVKPAEDPCKNGHDMTKTVAAAVPATCTEAGKTAVMGCSRCDYTEGGKVVEALGHDMSETVKEQTATCEEAGKTAVMGCSRCDYTEGGEEVKALGHDYSNELKVKDPTCKEAGLKNKVCKHCGDKIEEAIPATGKCVAGKWEVVKAATTTAEGEKVQKCKYCGDVLQRAKIAKLPSDPITNPAIPNTDAQA